KFFGGRVAGMNKSLYKLKTVKTFPQNVELAVEAPMGNGQLRTLHYSISLIPDNTGYEPRVADTRIGYFTTGYTDFGKFRPDEVRTRYINRWYLEKADPSLKLSPPKNPIIFYVEHTTPVRYRRWVKEGLLAWNAAYEKVGLINSIEVRFQDAVTGEHMEKDPEDVRYNFIRWLSNGNGTAIGPSRVHPLTGQILDADIILTDGWIRHWWQEYNEVIPEAAMEGLPPEAMEWLWQNPDWDPRIRLAPPARRTELLAQRESEPAPPLGGHALGQALQATDDFIGQSNEFEGLMGRLRQRHGLCMAPGCKTLGLAQMEMCLAVEGPAAMGVDASEQTLDGIPESFIGPLLVDLVAHEVGHTLGLRHNFKASSIYTYEQINGPEVKGKKPFAGSVMDYIPVNIVAGDDAARKGDFGMLSVGPYDMWAIEYGYSFEKDLNPILQRVAEPELVYATDEDTYGSDPLATRYDFAKDPLTYAENQMSLIRKHRAQLLDKFVDKGESWSRARRGYLMTLMVQSRSLSMMANWIGGASINRDKKGDTNARTPVTPVSADDQRKALAFCIANAFRDDAFGLNPTLLAHLTTDKWYDGDSSLFSEDGLWPVHDRVLGLQATVLTRLMNPVTLGRVYDNEVRVPADQDFITLPEVLDAIRNAVWTEIDSWQDGPQFTARQPYISSFRRNLQREHVDRLIDLATNLSLARSSPGYKPITDLATTQLASLKGRLAEIAAKPTLDPYSKSHLSQATNRIEKALNAQMSLTTNRPTGGGTVIIIGEEGASVKKP
ncbi:MAG: zinc-dependent metalloprotease, partial [Verrucomicrobiales bacterium]